MSNGAGITAAADEDAASAGGSKSRGFSAQANELDWDPSAYLPKASSNAAPGSARPNTEDAARQRGKRRQGGAVGEQSITRGTTSTQAPPEKSAHETGSAAGSRISERPPEPSPTARVCSSAAPDAANTCGELSEAPLTDVPLTGGAGPPHRDGALPARHARGFSAGANALEWDPERYLVSTRQGSSAAEWCGRARLAFLVIRRSRPDNSLKVQGPNCTRPHYGQRLCVSAGGFSASGDCWDFHKSRLSPRHWFSRRCVLSSWHW